MGFTFGNFAVAETTLVYRTCLEQKKKILEDACWKQAINPSTGVLDDGSKETTDALLCEENVIITAQEVEFCRSKAFGSEQSANVSYAVQTTKQVTDFNPNPAQPPRPPSRRPTPPSNTGAGAQQAGGSAFGNQNNNVLSDASSESAENAQVHANSDLATCSDLKASAERCCNNPLSCANNMQSGDKQSLVRLAQMSTNGPADGQSMGDYCKQVQQLESDGGNVNNGLGAVCTTNQVSCQQSCTQMAQKYQDLISSCGGSCPASAVYQEAYNSLNSRASACGDLKGKADQLSAQGIGSGSGQGYAAACQQQASGGGASSLLNSLLGVANSVGSSARKQLAVPNPAQNNPPMVNRNDPYGCAADPGSAACQSCSQDPSLPACRALAQAQPVNRGQTQFSQSQSGGSGGDKLNSFNTGGTLDGAGGTTALTKFEPKPFATVQGVPNNGGGFGAGTSGSSSAHLDGPSAPKVATTAAVSADILQGERSGGGYSPPSGNDGTSDIFPHSYGSAPRANTAASAARPYVGTDLKKYLPGGSLDPSRHLAGFGPGSSEINGQGADLFQRISNKMQEKCKLGILWECRP